MGAADNRAREGGLLGNGGFVGMLDALERTTYSADGQIADGGRLRGNDAEKEGADCPRKRHDEKRKYI